MKNKLIESSVFDKKLTKFLSHLWKKDVEKKIIKVISKYKKKMIADDQQGKEYLDKLYQQNKKLIDDSVSEEFKTELNNLISEYKTDSESLNELEDSTKYFNKKQKKIYSDQDYFSESKIHELMTREQLDNFFSVIDNEKAANLWESFKSKLNESTSINEHIEIAEGIIKLNNLEDRFDHYFSLLEAESIKENYLYRPHGDYQYEVKLISNPYADKEGCIYFDNQETAEQYATSSRGKFEYIGKKTIKEGYDLDNEFFNNKDTAGYHTNPMNAMIREEKEQLEEDYETEDVTLKIFQKRGKKLSEDIINTIIDTLRENYDIEKRQIIVNQSDLIVRRFPLEFLVDISKDINKISIHLDTKVIGFKSDKKYFDTEKEEYSKPPSTGIKRGFQYENINEDISEDTFSEEDDDIIEYNRKDLIETLKHGLTYEFNIGPNNLFEVKKGPNNKFVFYNKTSLETLYQDQSLQKVIDFIEGVNNSYHGSDRQLNEQTYSDYMEENEDLIEEDSKSDKKFEKVMGEFKRGNLHSGSKKGPVVKDKKQALAIAASEAGISKKKNESINKNLKSILESLYSECNEPEHEGPLAIEGPLSDNYPFTLDEEVAPMGDFLDDSSLTAEPLMFNEELITGKKYKDKYSFEDDKEAFEKWYQMTDDEDPDDILLTESIEGYSYELFEPTERFHDFNEEIPTDIPWEDAFDVYGLKIEKPKPLTEGTINQIDYRYYVVSLNQNKIISGFEFQEDARDYVREMQVNNEIGKLKVFTKTYLKSKGLDPDEDSSWGTDKSLINEDMTTASISVPDVPAFTSTLKTEPTKQTKLTENKMKKSEQKIKLILEGLYKDSILKEETFEPSKIAVSPELDDNYDKADKENSHKELDPYKNASNIQKGSKEVVKKKYSVLEGSYRIKNHNIKERGIDKLSVLIETNDLTDKLISFEKKDFAKFIFENCEVKKFMKEGKFDYNSYINSRPYSFVNSLVESYFDSKVEKISKKK